MRCEEVIDEEIAWLRNTIRSVESRRSSPMPVLAEFYFRFENIEKVLAELESCEFQLSVKRFGRRF